MKSQLKLSILVAVTLAGCATINLSAVPSSRDWQFVQSIGGLTIGEPHRDDRGHVLLPIQCDVSGTRTITVRPKAMNSALMCEPPSSQIRSRTVFLTIRTTTASRSKSGSRCPVVDLGIPPAGSYSVVYLNPDGSQHALGSIRIPR